MSDKPDKPKPPPMESVKKGATFMVFGNGDVPKSKQDLDDNKVIHLAFKSPHVDEDIMAFSACSLCRNKTFTLTHDRSKGFPLMRCAACGQHIGRMGWSHDDDTPKTGE